LSCWIGDGLWRHADLTARTDGPPVEGYGTEPLVRWPEDEQARLPVDVDR
jgi:hypothetical protein